MKIKLKTIAIAFLILLFFAPLIGAMLGNAYSTDDTKQFMGMQTVLMAIYNIPFLIISLFSLLISIYFSGKPAKTVYYVLLTVSILSSVLGSILMLTWNI